MHESAAQRKAIYQPIEGNDLPIDAAVMTSARSNLTIEIPTPKEIYRLPNLYVDSPTDDTLEVIDLTTAESDESTNALTKRMQEITNLQCITKEFILGSFGCIYLLIVLLLAAGCVILLHSLQYTDSKFRNGDLSAVENVLLTSISFSASDNNFVYSASLERTAGSEGDKDFVDFIRSKLQSYGYSNSFITLSEYEVFINSPFNLSLELLSSPPKEFQLKEFDPLRIRKAIQIKKTPFHYYSFSGKVSAVVVYANYGRAKDFQLLKSLSIDLQQAIVLVREGKIPVSLIVKNSQENGAKGVLTYNDPSPIRASSNATLSTSISSTYLMSRSVLFKSGDPSTPFDPSTPRAKHLKLEEILNSSVFMALPSIPSLPIPSTVAQDIFKTMKGKSIPSQDWKGGMNVEYRLGGEGLQVSLTNLNTYKLKSIWNVITIIKGSLDPDRYIILGGNRETATALLLELARGFRKLLKGGWQPLRTIILASWDADEFGMLGSVEWMQEYMTQLRYRAVVYMDVNSPVLGSDLFDCSASPSLKSAIYRATKKVYEQFPNKTDFKKNKVKSVFSRWMEETKKDFPNSQLPLVKSPFQFTKAHPFLEDLGIPTINIRYRAVSSSSTTSPLSPFENFDLQYHRIIAQIWGIFALSFADSTFLPYNFEHYAVTLNESLTTLKALGNIYSVELNYSRLNEAFSLFRSAARRINRKLFEMAQNAENMLGNKLENSPASIREMNDRLMLTERVFLVSKESLKHIVFTSNEYNAMFPGLYKAILHRNLIQCTYELDIICSTVEQAADFLTATMV